MQATRQGWPYYIRSLRPPARGGPRSGNGSPCAPDAGHPPGVALEVVTEARARPMQATRQGWPYYIRSRRPPARGGPTLHGWLVPLVEGSSIVGPPLAGLHGEVFWKNLL